MQTPLGCCLVKAISLFYSIILKIFRKVIQCLLKKDVPMFLAFPPDGKRKKFHADLACLPEEPTFITTGNVRDQITTCTVNQLSMFCMYF